MLYAFIFSFVFSVIAILFLIKFFNKKEIYQIVRKDVMDTHSFTKKQKPTMGGIVAVVSLILSAAIFTKFDIYVTQALIIATFFALFGFFDDYIKIFKKNTNGFKGSIKLILELLIVSGVIVWSAYYGLPFTSGNVFIPFNYFLKLSIFIGIFHLFLVVGSANAVNLTDGLDGLAIIPVITTSIGFLIIILYPEYFSPFNGEDLSGIAVLLASVIGSGVAFFFFNKFPAKIFMGDVGSLFYGSFLGYISVATRYEAFYAFAGLLFIVEILSSTLQVFLHFFWGKRLLKSAPLHHHFEKCGWSERKIILIFWLFQILTTILGLWLMMYRPLTNCKIDIL
ncbi:MAG: phospho-N-acetylmuramoyl-pentapeptide-transferase [Rickettsiales bacterium]|jgi:phospho-N-acetylmuramoyl-pentapeptide-transferase|nr:phospho-N-acetylmuramoyl-pentapeptide-transferase [Rickettsiales bacterium]